MSRIKPSAAMVVAIIALIASVTSGAYAAVQITTANIADRAVTNPKLSDNSVWHRNIGTGSVRNVNLSDNSVWHRNIGMGSVRLNNIQPATADALRGTSTAFGPVTSVVGTDLSAASATPTMVATGNITTTEAGQSNLVLNGYVQLATGNTDSAQTIDCNASVAGNAPFATVHTAQFSNSAPRWMQVVLVGAATGVSPGTHTIQVNCFASAGGFAVRGAAFTVLATG